MQLYGQDDYSRIRKLQTPAKARKYYLKILDTFKLSINETITIADKIQFESLNKIIDKGKDRIKSENDFDFIDNIFLEVQTKLIFQLIGMEPNRFKLKNVPLRKDLWELNSHRQIQYVQTNKQKKQLICSLLQDKYADRFPDFINFIDKIYYDECKQDLGKWIKWFQINHPDIYNELI